MNGFFDVLSEVLKVILYFCILAFFIGSFVRLAVFFYGIW